MKATVYAEVIRAPVLYGNRRTEAREARLLPRKKRTTGNMKHIFLVAFAGIVCLSLYTLALGQGKAWETYIQTGDGAITQKRYDDAEQAYREALKLSKEFKDNDAQIAVNLIKLAESLNLQAKHEEAEASAALAITALGKALKSSKSKDVAEEYYRSDTSASVLDKAADIFAANRKYSEAESIYKRIIVIREEAARVKESPKKNEDFLKFVVQGMTNAKAKVVDATDKLARLYILMRRF